MEACAVTLFLASTSGLGSLVPRPLPFIALLFAFSIIHRRTKEQKKGGPGYKAYIVLCFSLQPNCYSKVITVDGQKKIMIFALRK